MSERPPVTPQPSYANSHSNLKDKATPLVHKLASTDACPHRLLTHAVMDPALKEELRESCLTDVPGLIDYLFPDTVLPFPLSTFTAKILGKSTSKISRWNAATKTWKGIPDLKLHDSKGTTEGKLASFLNAIGFSLRTICLDLKAADRIPAKPRLWRSRNSTTPLTGGPAALRKPDLTLDDQKFPTWISVLSVTELKSKPEDVSAALDQLSSSAYMIFSTQDERCFNIGVSFCAFMVHVYVFDRSGVVGSEAFDSLTDPAQLIRLMAGLMLADKSAIGFDPTIVHKGGKRSIIIENKTYELLERLFISGAIRGRGTVCWRAHHAGLDYIIKDTWADTSRAHTEAEMIAAAAGIEGIPQLIAEETIMRTGDKVDSTCLVRNIIDRETYHLADWLEKLEIRVHRRLVLTPYALGIAHFASQRELLSVLIDAITAHRRLYDKGILHRDISLSNIMICRSKTRESQSGPSGDGQSGDEVVIRRGLLIDLDYSMFLSDEERTVAVAHRTRSLPFIAVKLMLPEGVQIKHEVRHDLESFFYVLFWICCHYAGPHNVERQNFDILEDNFMKSWLSNDSMETMAMCKSGVFGENGHFDRALSNIAPYFRNFIPCLREVRILVFKQTTQHEDLIGLLKLTMDTLPEHEDWSDKNDKVGYGKLSLKLLKRLREDHILPSISENEANIDSTTAHPKKRARSDQVALVPNPAHSYTTKLRAHTNTVARKK